MSCVYCEPKSRTRMVWCDTMECLAVSVARRKRFARAVAAAEQRTRYYPTTYSGSRAPDVPSYCYVCAWAHARNRFRRPAESPSASRCLSLCFLRRKPGTSRFHRRPRRKARSMRRARMFHSSRDSCCRDESRDGRQPSGRSRLRAHGLLSSAMASCMRPGTDEIHAVHASQRDARFGALALTRN